MIDRCRPALIVNAAGYTAVDRAEAELQAAFAVNADGPAHLAEAAAAAGSLLLHLSTDYVFDGAKAGPTQKTIRSGRSASTGPARRPARGGPRAAEHHVILRTSWVFGTHGTNFVKTMLRLGRERDQLHVVADQRGCPTGAVDIADAILAIAHQLLIDRRGDVWGTYHFAGLGSTTWYQFAEAIFERAAPFWGRRPEVVPISSADYPTPARRPAASVLDCTRFESTFAIPRRPWTEQLDAVLQACSARARPPSGWRRSRKRAAASWSGPARLLQSRCSPTRNGTGNGQRAHERHHSRRRVRHPAVPDHPFDQQAAAAGLRQAADLLSAVDADAGGDRRHPDHHTPQDQPAFQALLQDGRQWGLRLSYAVQPRPEGLAQALLIGREFIGGEPCCLILGDNLFFGHGLPELLRRAARRVRGATVFAYRVSDPGATASSSSTAAAGR